MRTRRRAKTHHIMMMTCYHSVSPAPLKEPLENSNKPTTIVRAGTLDKRHQMDLGSWEMNKFLTRGDSTKACVRSGHVWERHQSKVSHPPAGAIEPPFVSAPCFPPPFPII